MRFQQRQDDALTELTVAGALAGDRRAFELLYRQWQPRLSRFALGIVRSSEATADIMQDSWIGIAKGLPRLENPSRFRSWAYRIVSNKCRDWIRGEQARRRLENQMVAEKEPRPGTDSHLREQSSHAVLNLRELIKALPKDMQTVLRMFYLDELSIRETGAVLDVPEGTVKSRLYNARKTLKTILEKENE